MTDELILQLDSSQTGLNLAAQLFDKVTKYGSDITMVESATPGLYSGDMPVAPSGIYSIRYIDINDNDNIVSFGKIAWNGFQEITALDLEYVVQILSGDYVIAGDTLTINRSTLSRTIDSSPIAVFTLLENATPPDAAGGRSRTS